MNKIHLRKYGVQTTIDFTLFEVDGVDFRVDAVHAAGDTKIMKDEGAEANTTNGFTDEGQGYSIVLTATEMQAARIVVYIVDTATKVWLDDSFVVETYGNASAMHAMDFDDAVRGGMTALPNANADAAGGLPVSDAGGLDMDNLKTELDGLQGTDGKCLISTDAQDLSGTLDVNTKTATATALDSILKTSTFALAIADAIWDEVLTGATHNVASSAGKRLRGIDAAFEVSSGTAQAGTANTITLAAGDSATNDIYNGDRIVIVGGTGQGEHGIVTDYVGATKVATMSKNWVITPDNTSEYEVVPADVDVETWNNSAITGDGDWNELQTDVDAILVDTDVIDDGTSGLVKIAQDVAAILVDTGTTLQAELDGIQADTEDIQSRLPAALVTGRMSSDAVAISGSTDAADKLQASAETIVIGTVSHDNTASSTTVFYSDDITEATADHYNGRIVIFTSGALQNQATDITDYSLVSGEGKFTVTALTEAPADNVTFVIV